MLVRSDPKGKLFLTDVIVKVMLHLAPKIRFNAINEDKARCSWQYASRPRPQLRSLQYKAQIGAVQITDWGGGESDSANAYLGTLLEPGVTAAVRACTTQPEAQG